MRSVRREPLHRVRQVLQRLAHDRIAQLRLNRGASRSPTSAALRARLEQEHQAMHRCDQPASARPASGCHLHLAELSGNAIVGRYLIEIISRCILIIALGEHWQRGLRTH